MKHIYLHYLKSDYDIKEVVNIVKTYSKECDKRVSIQCPLK